MEEGEVAGEIWNTLRSGGRAADSRSHVLILYHHGGVQRQNHSPQTRAQHVIGRCFPETFFFFFPALHWSTKLCCISPLLSFSHPFLSFLFFPSSRGPVVFSFFSKGNHFRREKLQFHQSNMSGPQPVAIYTLRVPPGGALIPALPKMAAMVRINLCRK